MRFFVREFTRSKEVGANLCQKAQGNLTREKIL